MIKKAIAAGVLPWVLAFVALAGDPPYGELKLLEGYTYKRSSTFDTINGLIYRDGGLTIEYESGINEGPAVDPERRKDYIWYREQTVNGERVYLALTKPKVGTKWAPEKPRPQARYVLMVTFVGKFGPLDASNFHSEVTNEQEIADVLLMVLTYDPRSVRTPRK